MPYRSDFCPPAFPPDCRLPPPSPFTFLRLPASPRPSSFTFIACLSFPIAFAATTSFADLRLHRRPPPSPRLYYASPSLITPIFLPSPPSYLRHLLYHAEARLLQPSSTRFADRLPMLDACADLRPPSPFTTLTFIAQTPFHDSLISFSCRDAIYLRAEL